MRALRRSDTYFRKQEVLLAVKETDDEIRAIKVVHRTLMKLKPEARRRVVRYTVERHVTNTEPEPVEGSTKADAGVHPQGPPPSREQSLAIAKERLGA